MAEESKGNQEELIIQQKVYDMIMYAYPAVEQFPKSQKFSLAQDMKKCLDNIMRSLIIPGVGHSCLCAAAIHGMDCRRAFSR